MSMKIFVGGLSYAFTDQELNQLFTEQGKVTSATVIKDKFSNQSKGFGFVEMEDLKEAQNAIKALNGKELDGRAINVSQARPQENRTANGAGDRRGYRRSY